MVFLPIVAIVGATLTTTVSTNLFVSGVTLATTTYIGLKKTNKKK